MTSAGIGRVILAVSAVNASLTATLLYNNNKTLERNHEEAEARMDELEGTLRGHIGLIEESLDRIEGKQDGEGQPGRGKGMGVKAEELYSWRGRKERSS